MAVKMLPTYSKTKRPRGALLQLGIGLRFWLPRIGGRLWSFGFGRDGVNSGIPLYHNFNSNPGPLKVTNTTIFVIDNRQRFWSCLLLVTLMYVLLSSEAREIKIYFYFRASEDNKLVNYQFICHFYRSGDSAWWVVWLGRSPPKWQRRRLQR